MSKWIDADELRNFIKDQYFKCDMPEEWGNGVMWATSQINHYCNKADTPTIEPKRGEWIEHKERTIVRNNNFIDFFPTEYECSNCGLRRATYFINSPLSNYCPNCGADMREREGE